MKGILRKIFYLYYDGFRNMTLGKKLWIIVLIKLFVMYAILKLFFFHDFLESRFDTNKERSNYVIDQLTR